MTQVGGMDTGVVPGRILNSRIHAADGAAPHGDATRNVGGALLLSVGADVAKCTGNPHPSASYPAHETPQNRARRVKPRPRRRPNGAGAHPPPKVQLPRATSVRSTTHSRTLAAEL